MGVLGLDIALIIFAFFWFLLGMVLLMGVSNEEMSSRKLVATVFSSIMIFVALFILVLCVPCLM